MVTGKKSRILAEKRFRHFLVSLYLGDLVTAARPEHRRRRTQDGRPLREDVLVSVVRHAIIVYAVFAAITELGIAVQLTAPTFLILLGAVALAAAIAFGIGGREVAGDILQKAYGRSSEVAPSSSSGDGRR